MENLIDIWIGQAEKSWLDVLYSHAQDHYRSTFLPSHDHTHHLRVWNISKQLLREMAAFSSSLTPNLVEGLLIASLFHDLGMVQSTRENHGSLGRELCHSWFSEHCMQLPPGFDEILEAIEMHDRKDARIYQDKDGSPSILGILSVADDLEAMGVIGIYRYAEIYLQRGIPLKKLGDRILENAELRFLNITSSCRCTKLIGEYRIQLDELTGFFKLYNKQLEEVAAPDVVREGQLGVINYIRTRGMAGKLRPEKLFQISEESGADREITEFFSRLKHELETERR